MYAVAHLLLTPTHTHTRTTRARALPSGSAGFYGLMSANTSDVNPFGEWNFVWLAYCDGTSQTSNRDQTVDAGNGKKLHFRGRALLDAHLYQLEQKYKFLSTATEVIMSGTSAGGMSTFVQSSFVKSQLQVADAKLVAVPDAGWWWDHAQYGDASKHPWLDSMTGAIGPAVWNATLRGSMAVCLKDAEAEAEGGRGSVQSASGNTPAPASMAKCFTQPYAYSYTDVPTFIVQSFADPANIGFCYKGPCSNFEKCSPSQLADVQNYGTENAVACVNFFPVPKCCAVHSGDHLSCSLFSSPSLLSLSFSSHHTTPPPRHPRH